MHTSKHTAEHRTQRDAKRAHVVIPRDLLQAVDALVGPRRRSEFFVDAAREKVARAQLRQAARTLAGSLRNEAVPGWETPEASSAWVRSLREESDRKALSDDPQL